ncbi:MAG: hypothetical protein JWN86_445 [Planctomycetota bacterium]|nr:hypothetical protein [Planctomycetota bacterium]
MTALFDSKPRVKSARKPFGYGLGRNQAERLPKGPNVEDAAWAAYELNKACRDYAVVSTAEDRHFDRMAEDSAAMERAERGIRAF